MSRFVVGVGVGVLTLAVLAGCGGGGSSGGGAPERAGTLTVHVVDVTDMPISGAVVDVTVKGVERRATTGPDGTAEVADLPIGEFAITVSADGFDSVVATDSIGSGPKNIQWTLRSDREWSAGWGIVLGSRVIERAGDDSAMTFSVDLAVVGETSDAIETLTATQFSIVPGGGCGGEEWGGGIPAVPTRPGSFQVTRRTTEAPSVPTGGCWTSNGFHPLPATRIWLACWSSGATSPTVWTRRWQP